MRPGGPPLIIYSLALAACGSNGTTASDASDARVVDAAAACVAVDAATSCAADAGCDFFLHCGCGESDKCSVGASGASCAAAGAGRAGSTCTVDADCARGTICVPFFGALQCLQFCDRAHRCPSGQDCYVTVTVRDRADQIAGEVCGPTCKLVEQDCAAAGTACYLSDRHCGIDEGLCLAAGAASQGVACTRMGDCQKGYLCIDPAGPSTPMCAKICDRRDGMPSCDVGTCRDLPGHSQTGICLP
jgi:hypothetical protein